MAYLIIKQSYGKVDSMRKFKTIRFKWKKKNHMHIVGFMCIIIGNQIENLCVWIRIFLYDYSPIEWVGALIFIMCKCMGGLDRHKIFGGHNGINFILKLLNQLKEDNLICDLWD